MNCRQNFSRSSASGYAAQAIDQMWQDASVACDSMGETEISLWFDIVLIFRERVIGFVELRSGSSLRSRRLHAPCQSCMSGAIDVRTQFHGRDH